MQVTALLYAVLFSHIYEGAKLFEIANENIIFIDYSFVHPY